MEVDRDNEVLMPTDGVAPAAPPAAVMSVGVPDPPRAPSPRARRLVFALQDRELLAAALGVGLLALAGLGTVAQVAVMTLALYQSERTGIPWPIAGGLVVALASAGAVAAAYAFRQRASRIELFRRGRPAPVCAIWVEPVRSVEVAGRRPLALVWEFQVEDGAFYRGRLATFAAWATPGIDAEIPSQHEYSDLLEPGKVVVLYDPQDPRQNTLYVP